MSEVLHRSVGVLGYHRGDSGSYKLAVECDQEIVRYYRSLIPKWIRSNPQMYGAHISVIRKEEPKVVEHWGKYEGHEVEYEYSPVIHVSQNYVWLNVWSRRLAEIRLELGLPVDSPYTRPPDGFEKTMHMSIGNFKEIVQSQKTKR